MNESLRENSSITELSSDEYDAVVGSAPGDSYVCQVKDGKIVTGSCKKVD
jgi:hypothetical protein